jgi:plastocyanin
LWIPHSLECAHIEGLNSDFAELDISKEEMKMKNKRLILSVVLTVLTVLAVVALARPVLAGNTADQSASAEVKIDNFSFSPANLTVAAGTTVTWINRDDIPHVVVSSDDPKVFKSKALDTDEKFSFTFTKAGTYPYFCAIHPKMTGKVIVQ